MLSIAARGLDGLASLMTIREQRKIDAGVGAEQVPGLIVRLECLGRIGSFYGYLDAMSYFLTREIRRADRGPQGRGVEKRAGGAKVSNQVNPRPGLRKIPDHKSQRGRFRGPRDAVLSYSSLKDLSVQTSGGGHVIVARARYPETGDA